MSAPAANREIAAFDPGTRLLIHCACVFRALAVIVGVAMLSVSGSGAVPHVHAYSAAAPADHHHSPATHTHAPVAHPEHPDSDASEDVVHLESCDPHEHAIAVVFTCVAPQPDHALVPSACTAPDVAPPDHSVCHVTPSDVRAHSPPRLTDAPLRAPPLVDPA